MAIMIVDWVHAMQLDQFQNDGITFPYHEGSLIEQSPELKIL